MRVLYERKACVLCNSTLQQVVVVPLRHYRQGMTFEEGVALPGCFQDKPVQMWFLERSRQQQLKNVRGWKCSHRSCNGKGQKESLFANATQLRAHGRCDHRAIYCEVCFTGKKSFVSEMPLFSLDNDRNYSSRLRGHLRKEHPQCRFCRRYYLDDDALYAHLQEAHETCSVCERSGRMHEYFSNFEQLERHYEKDHYVCRHETCRGVVFATQIEMQTHEHTRHGDNSRGTRSRTLRVNLQQLHGERDPRSSTFDRDAEIERERQLTRRRNFLSSSVVFSGALNFDDAAEDVPSNQVPPVSSAASSSQTRPPAVTPAPLAGDIARVEVRRPDDGHFHPMVLPRDGEELHARNTVLVRSMRGALDAAAYEQFKQTSAQFRAGKISSDEYYDAAVDAFGFRAAIRDFLPELVALLPTPLLREPLLQICLKRTDTKSSDAGITDTPSSKNRRNGTGSSSGGREEDQFPTLSGAPLPVRGTPAVRRFGAPGPEEFPRLGRVNKNGKPAEEITHYTQGSSSTHGSATGSAGNNLPQQKTAASLLRQLPTTRRMFGNQPARGASRGASVDNSGSQLPGSLISGPQLSRPQLSGPQLSSSAFPSLTPSAPRRDLQNARSLTTMSGMAEAGVARGETVSTDLSERVGPVWGGAAATGNNRGSKKRGPGQRRRPASPPKGVIMTSSVDFPGIRSTSVPENPPIFNSAQSQEPGNTRKNKVIDVSQISRERRTALAKSNLPKIGGSGYGFAWERKKAQQKKREIRDSVNSLGNNRSEQDSLKATFSSTVTLQNTNVEEESLPIVSAMNSSKRDVEHELEVVDADDLHAGITRGLSQARFDPYSFVKEDKTSDDAATSFFQSGG